MIDTARCDACANGSRQPVSRSRVAERNGATAVVLGVPVEECPSRAHVWLTMETALRLDEMFDRLLASGAELAQSHWGTQLTT